MAQGAWTPTGQLHSRYRHTATLLQSGKVLVVGGSTLSRLDSAELYDPATGAWTSTGSLAQARVDHTATLLPNGKVLVVGGAGASFELLATAELFDPKTGSFSSTGSLSQGRYNHTATLLPNGKVLVAGGNGSGIGGLVSAEVYDPVTDAWTPTGSLAAARVGHSMTLLQNGNVLVAGGDDVSGDTAEIYNPVSGAWAGTGALLQPRAGHSATLLQDGRVLAVGGSGTESSAELYDPGTGTWAATGSRSSAPSGQFRHTATLLPSGRVLVAGGGYGTSPNSSELYDPASGAWAPAGPLSEERYGHTATLLPNGTVLVAGGYKYATLASAEIYDPGASQWSWTPTGAMAQGRDRHTATLLPTGKVLVTGGTLTASDSSFTAGAELYDPLTGIWASTGSMTQGRHSHTQTLLPDGRVLVAGGYRSLSLTSAEIYNPTTGTWTGTGSLTSPRWGHTATLLPNGRVLVVGGATYSRTAEIFDPTLGTWTPTGSLSFACDAHTARLLPDGRVLVSGGFGGTSEVYDPGTGTWAVTGSLATPVRTGQTQTLLPNGTVMVAGGTAGGYGGAPFLNSVEVYSAASGAWTAAGPLSEARQGHSATLLPNGHVLAAGGLGGLLGAAYEISSAEVYDPATRRWTNVGSMAFARGGHTATLLPNGRVLIVGGRPDDPFANSLASAELFGPTPAAAASYPSSDVPKNILDVATIQSTLPIGDTRTLSDVNVTLNITHTWDSDLALTLIAPNGTRVTLASTLGASGDNYTNTTFDDEAATPITSGVPPFSGTFRPQSPLTALDGMPANGTWKLEVTDQAGQDVGVLNSWSLALTASDEPNLTSATTPISYGSPVVVSGVRLGAGPEGGDGTTTSSAVNYPLFQMRSLESGQVSLLLPDARTRFSDDPMTVNFSSLPASLDPGWYSLFAIRAGAISPARLVRMTCGVAITTPPQTTTVPLGGRATFTVSAQGGVSFRWERNRGAGWETVPGAFGSSYQTDVVAADDAGVRYRVVVSRACQTVTSAEATLSVSDTQGPTVTVQSPTGGRRIPVSTSQSIIWTATDNIRVCKATASLEYSNDGGGAWLSAAAAGGLPFTVDQSAFCLAPGLGPAESQLTYTVPATFPSGQAGSLYRVRVRAWDLNGNASDVATSGTFYIVKPDPEAQTLILWNRLRMQSEVGSTAPELDELALQLSRLADHERVRGVVEDVGLIAPLSSLYAKWDAAHLGNTADQHNWANSILFGCDRASVSDTYPSWCAAGEQGIEGLQDLVSARKRTLYANLKYVIVVGDDRVIPFARLIDETSGNASENRYLGGATPDLTTGTTVGRALSANRFLSDDPLLTDAVIRPDDLSGLFRPDFSGGRLVERADEIIKTISTFMGQDGVMDLTAEPSGHRVLVTGYDFMLAGAKGIRSKWESVPGAGPVGQTLLGESWGDALLRQGLQGNGGGRYGVMSLNGHASHYLEGVPAGGAVSGLNALDVSGTDRCSNTSSNPLNANFDGAVVYSMGCHGGLVVPGSCSTTNDHSLDLPQTFLARGAAVYLGNTGYGYGDWGVVAYSMLLSDLFTQRLVGEQSIAIGDAVRLTKSDSYLRDRGGISDPSRPGRISGLDAYDRKILQQWTLFGMPMYELRLRTGTSGLTSAPPVVADSSVQQIGNVFVRRAASLIERPPQYVTKLSLQFDLSGSDVYTKWHGGEQLASVTTSCPNESDPRRQGCYYRLNNKMTTGSGMPVQPMMVYDSRLSGTSQHGVLWMGGTYVEETNWKPVFGGVVTNGFENSEPLPAPRNILSDAITTQTSSQGGCRASDDEVNSMAIATGELLKDSFGQFTIERRYVNFDAEVLYYNNTNSAEASHNCQRTAPGLSEGGGLFAGGAYHKVTGQTVEWAVPGLASDVWRVVVVYNDEANSLWEPLELVKDGSGVWRGSKGFAGATRVGYLLQAVDNKGNVGRLKYQDTLPNSGIVRSFPLVVDAVIGGQPAPTVTTLSVTGIAETAATLNGTVNPNGLATDRRFEYGLTAAYGSVVPAVAIGSGTAEVAVQATVTGLVCNTSYHYRAVGENAGGTSNGDDVPFTTLACLGSNTSAGTARSLTIDSTMKDSLSSVRMEAWYRIRLFSGRSYQFSAWPVDHEQAVDAPTLSLAIFSDAAGTVPATPAPTLSSSALEGSSNGNGDGLPSTMLFAPSVTGVYKVRVLRTAGATGHSINVAVRETTLFSPWSSRAAGFEGFIELHNNTNVAVSVTLRAYDSAGLLQGAGLTLTLQPNATEVRTASQVGVPAGAFAGIVLTHNGAVGAVSGNVTTLSGASGLSFDSPFTARGASVLSLPGR